MTYRYSVGDKVVSRIDNMDIKAGDVGTIIDFANYPGEEYPWTMETEDGRRGAFNGFELMKEYE